MAEQSPMQLLGITQEQMDDIRLAGYCYIKQGVYDIAITFFEALISLNPLSLYDLQTLGALYLQTKEYNKAIQHLDKALTIEPRHYLTKLNKAKTLFLLGEKEKGKIIAAELKNATDRKVAEEASALLLAHPEKK